MAYWYKDIYIRTASNKYGTGNLDDHFVHLNNDAVQKKSEDYGKYETGNKMTFQSLVKKLPKVACALDDMKKIAKVCVQSTYRTLGKPKRKFCFEVFGFDFMIDNNYKSWLIEINTNPCLELSSPWLAHLIPAMLDGALELTVDKIWRTINGMPPTIPPTATADNTVSSKNRWELIFTEDDPSNKIIDVPE
jgi:hypothetical protein